MAQLSKECDRAAVTLMSFLGGCYQPSASRDLRVTDRLAERGKLPTEIIKNAKGLAIFSAFRAGMWIGGASGAGIVVARLPNGKWSPPSGFSVKSGAIGLVLGVDHYDCVCVLNTQDAVDAYTSPEFSVGSRMDFAAGPVGGKIHTGDAPPVWTYTRSRGLYGALALDGTVLQEQQKANAEFYGGTTTAAQVLQGTVEPREGPMQWPVGAQKLTRALEWIENGS